MPYPAQQGDTIQEAYPSSISGATPSTFGSDNLEPSRQVVVGPQPSSYRHIPQDGSNLSSKNPLFTRLAFVVRPATPPIVSLRDATYPSASDTGSSILGRGLLSPKPESMTSDTHSCASDTSSPAAPPEIYCDIDDCCIAFSGRHRKGNLARHKRNKHRGRVYVCENASCERMFNRQDARLKHYRTHHQRLATPYIARPETRHANRDRDQYSDFMSSTSG
ncbi:hypothetical protein ACET3X_009632 [Alternaria dauci]|uniref:C2H2-type domain-containing protein n=1 Tax=Alternaria dauci TaxID=48095 RepID=A0ABR3U664_9PLEO